MLLSLVIPCYNESKNIPIVLDKLSSVISSKDIEVIIVNNGSTDDTENVLSTHLPQYAFARVVKVAVNRGYGLGIISGLQAAKGEFIGYTHADMQTDPQDIMVALRIVQEQANPANCYIKGNRKNRPWFDQLFTIGMSMFESIYLRTILWDINAQPNLFHRSFFASVASNCPWDFSLDLYLLYMAKKRGLKVIRFNVIFPPRIHGTSSWNTGFLAKWKFIKRTIKFSITLKKKL